MKKIITILFITFSFISLGQRQTFECNKISNSSLLDAYSTLKDYGLKKLVKATDGSYKDLMVLGINYFSFSELRQLCINAWNEVETNGTDYCYSRYIQTIGYVSKSYYISNIDYFEMLRLLNITLSKLNFK